VTWPILRSGRPDRHRHRVSSQVGGTGLAGSHHER
jgi:hypothetical protein